MTSPAARSRIPWLVGGLLVVLLAALAALQLRWLGQVEAADRQRLEAAAETALAAFAADLDREVSRAWLTFLPGPHGSSLPRRALAERLERWRETAPAPELVREVVVVEAEEWVPGAPRTRPMRVPALLPQLPGVQVPLDPAPLWAAPRGETRESGEPEAARRRALRVVFDREHLAEELLPGLVRRHLVPVLGEDVDVRVTVAATGALVYATEPDLAGPFEWQAPLFDLLPHDDLRRLAFGLGVDRGPLEEPGAWAERLHEDGHQPPRRPRHLAAVAALLEPPAGWVVAVRPAEGSLAAALARARRGNAALVLGLLALLGTAAVALALYARRAQEMARRQVEFTAAVSHELRTPIAAIRSLADNLADGLVREPEQARLYGAQIARQGARLTDMVEQVLALASGEAGGRPRSGRPVDLDAVVREAVAEVTAGAPSGSSAAVAVELAPDLPPVLGDPSALERAVANLVGNAVKHGGEGVRVRTRATADGREVAIEVADRGPGIPPGERERLFEPFFRGEGARHQQLPGSGLGLHLVQRIAAAHGGRVDVESSPGRGATFTLVLPARPEAAGAAAPVLEGAP